MNSDDRSPDGVEEATSTSSQNTTPSEATPHTEASSFTPPQLWIDVRQTIPRVERVPDTDRPAGTRAAQIDELV
ncbi:MAG: hypothetical protein WA880_03790 [Ornithinimicrobium sp.]